MRQMIRASVGDSDGSERVSHLLSCFQKAPFAVTREVLTGSVLGRKKTGIIFSTLTTKKALPHQSGKVSVILNPVQLPDVLFQTITNFGKNHQKTWGHQGLGEQMRQRDFVANVNTFVAALH